MNSSYLITFTADDRPGLVEQLSGVIRDNDGNWLESRLSQLGGKFAGLIMISLPRDNAAALEAGLSALEPAGLSVTMSGSGERPEQPRGSHISLSILGPDRVGIVQEVSAALARQQINVIEMDSAVSSAPMSAEMIFNASVRAWIPESTDMNSLRSALEKIADDMTLEIDLEEAG